MNPSDEQVLQAFDQAPPIIRDSLSGGTAVDFMSVLPSRYGIHIDTAGYVMEFIRNMLLGFLRPEQFMGKLQSVGVSDEVGKRITTDLNKEVFIPLRDAMRTGGAARTNPIPQTAVMRVAPQEKLVQKPDVPIPLLAPAVSKQPSYNLVRETRATVQIPAPTPVPTIPSMVEPIPTVRTMQHDMALMQQGGLPAPYPAPSMLPHPSQATPARMFQTASVPVTSMPAQTKPTPQAVHVTLDAPAPLPARQMPQIASAKESSSDPYRETI